MTSNMAWHALGGLLVVSSLLWLLYGPLQSLIVSWARNEIFVVRDELFDLAMEGRLYFDSEVYRALRRSINQSIRFHHKMTWLRLLVFRLVSGRVENPQQNLERALNRLEDRELQVAIRQKMKRMSNILFYSMILRAPALLLMTPFIAAFYLAVGLFTRKEPRTQFRRVQSRVNKNIQADIVMEADLDLGRRRKAYG